MRFLLFALTLLVGCGTGMCSSATPINDLNAGDGVEGLSLPEGFRITLFTKEVEGARSMALGPRGTLFVSTRKLDRVYAVRDEDGDGVADGARVLLSGLDTPNGVAVRDGDLYVAEISRVLRYDDIEDHLDDPPEPVVVVDGLPTDRAHGWKFIAFGPDGHLYVPVGAPCNVCDPEDPRYSSILRVDLDAQDAEPEIFAHGVRNTVGFDWHPETGVLYFTDNGRDRMGDDIPPDELNRAPEAGLHFGFPYCHGGDVPDPELDSRPCSEFTPPIQKLGPHVAALGMRFYTGEMFPETYHDQIFIAEHGSWNRSRKIGYRVTLVRLDDAGRATSYEPFATGWLDHEEQEAWGRPVDVQVMPDGALLVSDDAAGAIYRITYEEP